MNIENIQLIFQDGGIFDEEGTMLVGPNHLAETDSDKTLCGLPTVRTETYCWSYYDPDPTDYDNHEETLLENVECEDCEEVLREAIMKTTAASVTIRRPPVRSSDYDPNDRGDQPWAPANPYNKD